MTTPSDAEVAAAFARSLTSWHEDRIDAEFTDPSTGGQYVFTITRCCPAESLPAAGDDRDRVLIRARGEAMRELAKAHAAEFDALVDARLRELGIGTPDPARRS